MSEPLLDDETLAELRALEAAGMTLRASITRDGVSVVTNVPLSLIVAGSPAIQPATDALGGARGAWTGFVPWGTNLRDGDGLTVSGKSYAVQGAATLDTCVVCALSEVGRG